MAYQYVCRAPQNICYQNGYSQVELKLDTDFKDIQDYGIHFYRCNLQAGFTTMPKLEADNLVFLMFNGKQSYIRYGDETFYVTEPAFFFPEFDKQAYTVGAVEDTEFIMGVVRMNDWDKMHYKRWHKHLPFFTLYSNCTEYGQDCKLSGTHSWTVLQGMQLGHITIGVVRAIGAGTDELGHSEVHQWNYCLGESDFTMDVEGETSEQGPGDFSFIYGGKDHKLLAKPGKEVFYVWVEYYAADDLEEFYRASISNRTPKEAYAAILKSRCE